MSKNKKTVTAPLSYDPGKGRPKEYLAYLNWQEMQALRRLNGNNMERGPMGLPSFPPDWKGSDTSTGNWSGAGGSTTGAGTGGGSDSGGSVGGTESGTASSAASNAAAAAAASEQTSSDAAAQQAAAQQSAAEAARNAAVREDAAKGGIASINVGPMQTPVQIGGGQIFGSLSKMASGTYGLSAPDVGPATTAPSAPVPRANPLNDPTKFIQQERNVFSGVNPVALSRVVRLQEEFGKPLTITSGVRDPVENTQRGGAKKSQHIHGNAIDIAIPGASAAETARLINTASGVGFTGIGGYRPGKIHVDVGGTRVWGPSYGKESISRLPGSMQRALTSHVSGATPKINIDYASLEREPSPTYTPDQPAEPATNYAGSFFDPAAGLGVSSVMNLPGALSDFRIPAIPEASEAQKSAIAAARTFMPESAFQSLVNKSVADAVEQSGFRLGDTFASGLGALTAMRSTPEVDVAGAELEGVEDDYRNQPGPGVMATRSIVDAGQLGYPMKPDGTPYTAQDIAELPQDIQNEIMDKARFRRMTDENYPLTPEQETKVRVAGGIGRVASLNPFARLATGAVNIAGSGIGLLPGEAGEFGEGLAEAAGQIRDPAQAVREYEEADPLQKIQIGMRAGRPNYVPGTESVYTGTQTAGGIPTQEPGGKGNDVGFTRFASPYTASYASSYGPDRVSASGDVDLRWLYRRWDRGIGIPSPGDPDYNEYQEYLRERGTSASV